jgi:pimeloyl-ACP methyl ester carboxylesterase
MTRGIGGFVGVAMLAGAAASALAQPAIPRAAYERSAQRVALLGGRRLNFLCQGVGSPTVLLESGFGVGAFAWAKVQPRIAPVTRVCAYDRAGYGFSDPGPLPRDGAAVARDLDNGLRAARIRGPYVLVGHSAGGLYQRLFAARRRADVVGMVFVDSSVEHQTQRLSAAFGPGVASLEGVRRKPARCLAATQATPPGSKAERDACTALATPGAPGLGLRPSVWKNQLSELDTLFERTSDEVDRTGDLLADIPAIVLTASNADGPHPPQDPGAAAWQRFHAELAARFHHGEQRLVKSGHLMMNERPEVVAAATIELVERARKRTNTR